MCNIALTNIRCENCHNWNRISIVGYGRCLELAMATKAAIPHKVMGFVAVSHFETYKDFGCKLFKRKEVYDIC